MPIQNFYIDCEIDGRESKLTGGPKAKDGGFSLTIYQRSEGKKITALKVAGNVRINGTLALNLWKRDNMLLIRSNVEILITHR